MSAPVLSVVEKLPKNVARRQTIEMLEYFMEEAKAGRIVSVAIVGISNGGGVVTGASYTESNVLLLGGLSRLTWQINAGVEEEEIGEPA